MCRRLFAQAAVAEDAHGADSELHCQICYTRLIALYISAPFGFAKAISKDHVHGLTSLCRPDVSSYRKFAPREGRELWKKARGVSSPVVVAHPGDKI